MESVGRNILNPIDNYRQYVALRMESVGRNIWYNIFCTIYAYVALRMESVGRNPLLF